ncbi:MAG: PTS sugar transporter subunit IIA [Pseudomonadota bacterium]
MPYNIQIDAAIPNIKAMNKEQVFKALIDRISKDIGCSAKMLFDRLMEREQLSMSAIGQGVAIPHLKTDGLRDRYVAVATLSNPIDFGAIDGEAVDLIGVILSPSSHGGLHLRGLSRISRLLKNEELCQKLREAQDEDTLKSLFSNPQGWLLAA